MHKIVRGSTHNLPDVESFLETLPKHDGFFDGDGEIFIARAPGRLDVMGGIADYSGSLVLEMPIREAAICALQKNETPTMKITSVCAEGERHFEMPLADLLSFDYAAARVYFKRDSETSWAAYVAGVFVILAKELDASLDSGASILIDSKVPQGKGVSSSAAIEVAAMKAFCAAFNIDLQPRDLAILCQKVENLVVGAPCGVMDQMTSSCGEAGKFLSLLCQPAEINAPVKIPEEISFWGIDSGIRHSVGAGDYGFVRMGAFMGLKIIGQITGENTKYLANISPAQFESDFAAHLPDTVTGAEFLHRYGDIADTVTSVDPARIYAVRKPTAHPVYENARVHRFAALLNQTLNEANLNEMGSLMYASHESYSACGLGSDETDLLVSLVRETPGLYGAKITGGGSGGTVVVLGKKDAADEIENVAEKYEKLTGYRPYIFSGSSPGAADFGHLVVK